MLRLIMITLIFNLSFSEAIVHRYVYKPQYAREFDNSLINTYNNRNEEELINFINNVVESNDLPGVSVSVVKGDNVVWNQGFGMANIEQDIVVSDSTMFMLASVSKTVTATALMKLWEDGLIDLNQNINQYLSFNVSHPNFPMVPITAKMLLSHTSGIKDNWSVMPYYEGDSEIDLARYLQEYLVPGGDFYNQNLNYTISAPGTNFQYSNIAVALIGHLVEAISNQPFNQFCNEHIFEPLNMESRWFLSEVDINNLATLYEISFGTGYGNNCFEIGCGVFSYDNPCQCDEICDYYEDCCGDYDEVCGEGGTGTGFIPIEHYGYSDYPSGQLRTSSKDLAKFLVLFSNGGIYQDIRILEQETIEYMKSIPYPNIDSQQAYIWYYKNQAGRNLFGHNGGDWAVSADMFLSLSDEIGVIVLTNCANYSAMIEIENAVFDYAEQYDFISNVMGDLNFDLTVNILDVIVLVNAILQNQYIENGDLNYDNQINIQDAILMVYIITS